jgi:hypothetical protein
MWASPCASKRMFILNIIEIDQDNAGRPSGLGWTCNLCASWRLVGLTHHVPDARILCCLHHECVLPQCQQYQQVIGVGVVEFSLHVKRDKATVKIFDGNVRCMAKMEFAVALSLLAPAPTTIQTGKYSCCMHEMHSDRRLRVWGTFYRRNDDFVGIMTPLVQACASDSTLPRDHDPGSNRTLQAPAFPQH